MRTKTLEVFYCIHCNKHGLSKHAMVWHELHCLKSPANQHVCYTCDHLEIHENETEEVWREGGGNIYTEEKPIPRYYRCGKLNKTLFSISALRKKLPDKYPDQFDDQELMPFGCESHQCLPKGNQTQIPDFFL